MRKTSPATLARLQSKWDTNPEWRHQAIAVGRVQSENPELHQGEIANFLNARLGTNAFKQPEVSRMLTLIRKTGLTRSMINESRIAKEDLQQADLKYFFQEKLYAVLRRRVPNFTSKVVVVAGSDAQFFSGVAENLISVLSRAKCVGINWGRNIQHTIAQLRHQVGPTEQERFQHIHCFPLTGDPVYHLHEDGVVTYTASTLAADLQEILTGQRTRLPCLTGVPAYIARRFLHNGTSGKAHRLRLSNSLLEFIQSMEGYREILDEKNEERRLNELDTVLTSIGVLPNKGVEDTRTGAFINERLRQEGQITREDLRSAICGDIGGWLVPYRDPKNEKVTKENRGLAESLNKGWMGPRDRDFRRIVREASRNKTPGVLLIATSPAKAPMALECLKENFVSTLLCDSGLGQALFNLADSR